jgi:hypothetical protein
MKVFCHEHKRGFFAPRQSPIKCENRGHVLGELDFAGQHSEDDSSFHFQWEYCCNCEHFSVVNFEDNGLQRCPVCTRRSSTLYLCDRCYTISFESNTPLETKNFTLTSEGVPSPCCPGCLHPAASDLREHSCDDAQVSFVTALNTCPVCNERLDIRPSFPATIAQYLKRTKAANKTFVTFDYECGLFVPIEDGEFVLIRNNDETNKTFVLPRASRLNSLRDFYELYQDYYHCAAPASGEVTISEPAVVVPIGEGWKLLAPGVFAVIDDQPKRKAPVPAPQPIVPVPTAQAKTPVLAPQPIVPVPTAQPKTPVIAPQPDISMRQPTVETDGSSFNRKAPASTEPTYCTYCDTLIEAKYAFCWKCGSARNDSVKASKRRDTQETSSPADLRPSRSRLIVQAMEEDEADSQTVQHEKRASRLERRELNGHDWLTQPQRDPSLSQKRSVLKLFIIAVVGLLVLSLAVLGVLSTRSSSTPQTAEVTPQASAPNAAPAQPAAAPVASVELKPVSLKTSSVEVPELALAQLRQMRDHSKMLRSLSETETKYSSDYRFPYERARVVVMDHKKNFHEEAFAALARAAQKAINSGKSSEMLQSLNKDGDGDFQKLSHDRREWSQLQRALKSRNASGLSANEGL